MSPAELYDMLKKAQEPKGFFFNKDKDWVLIPFRIQAAPLSAASSATLST